MSALPPKADFSHDAFGGGREGIVSEAHGLKFRQVDCIPRWGLEARDRQTALIHTLARVISDDEATGALPGRLIRGARSAPS